MIANLPFFCLSLQKTPKTKFWCFFPSKLGKRTQTAFHHVERRGDNYAMSAKMLLKWVLVPISASLSSHHHVPCDVPHNVPLALCLIFAIFFSRAFLLPSFPSAALSKPLEIPRKVRFGRDHEKSAENGKREIFLWNIYIGPLSATITPVFQWHVVLANPSSSC